MTNDDASAISAEELERLRNAAVFDTDGDKIGPVEQIYVHDTSGRPSWASVRTGLFRTREALVPLDGVDLSGAEIHVPFSKDVVKDAPKVEADDHISRSEESELHAYYRGHGWGGGDDAAPRATDADTARAGDDAWKDDAGTARNDAADNAPTGAADDPREAALSGPSAPADPAAPVAPVATAAATSAAAAPAAWRDDEPVEPTEPSTPQVPDAPETPQTPEPPNTPEAPEPPLEPLSPLSPSTPTAPQAPSAPAAPSAPELSRGACEFQTGEAPTEDFAADATDASTADSDDGSADDSTWTSADATDSGTDDIPDAAVTRGSYETPYPGDARSDGSGGRRISAFDDVTDGGYSIGSAAPIGPGVQPMGHPVRAWEDTKTFRSGAEGDWEREPDVWFMDEQAAVNAGFRPSEY